MNGNLKTLKRPTFWRGLWRLSDPKIWTASVVPFVLGHALAYERTGSLRWPLALTALAALLLIEVGKNGLNDYFDYASGADLFVEPKDRTPFSGGKRVLVDRLLSPSEVRSISAFCFAAAALLGAALVRERPGLLLFGFSGLFLAVAYSAPPFRLSYRGLGELAVGIAFGPAVVNGAFYLQTGFTAPEPALLSLPLALLVANVLWINEVPDVEADRRAGKWNLVARLGRENALAGYIVLFICAYLSVAVAALALRRYSFFVGLLGALWVPAAIRCARENMLDSQKLTRANALTIRIYLATGLLLAGSAALGGP